MPTPAELSALHARALDLLVAGDTAGGITDLNAYLAAEPDDAEAWLELGTAYTSIAHWIQGADALRRAVDLDGEDVDARRAYARALVHLKKLDDAVFQLLQAARIEPPDPRVLRELGVVFYDKRLYDKAVTWLDKAVAAAPDDARAHYALGLAHEARRDMGAAVAAYREAVRQDPAFGDARLTLADALAGMGEHEGAIAELTALLALDRTNEQAAHNREVLLRALDEMRKHRLLGKGLQELEASALISEGAFRKKGAVTVGETPTPPARPVTVGETPTPPARPVTVGETPTPPARPVTVGETPTPPARPVTVGETPTPPARPVGEGGAALVIRYTAPLVEVYVTLDGAHAIASLLLVLTDPDRAARAEDDVFKVTVIADDGRREPADFATAVTLTFLREALGCPMTQASALYARLLGSEGKAEWGDVALGFDSVPRPDKPSERRHGVRVSLR